MSPHVVPWDADDRARRDDGAAGVGFAACFAGIGRWQWVCFAQAASSFCCRNKK
jgi:hypothetical protein